MIKNDTLFDEDLQAVMSHDGKDRCHERADLIKKEQKVSGKETMDANWDEQEEQGNPILDSILSCLKPTALFLGLIALCVYWQNAELMDPAAAIPTMMVCAALAGFYVGKQVRK